MRIIFPNPAGAISLLETIDPQLLDEAQTDRLNSWLTQAQAQLEARIEQQEFFANAFEEAAKLEPEWNHIPGYAEFEVNRAGDVRNALTKLPLKAFGTAARKEAFMLRADNGVKRMIHADWILQHAFPN